MDLGGQAGELRITLEIKRAETGKTEAFGLIGRLEDGVDILDEFQEGSTNLTLKENT